MQPKTSRGVGDTFERVFVIMGEGKRFCATAVALARDIASVDVGFGFVKFTFSLSRFCVERSPCRG